MQALGYRPHAAARGMRGQTYTLGVLLPDLSNPFFADIVAGIDEALVRTQYQPLLGVGHVGGDDRARLGRCHDRPPDRRADPDRAAHARPRTRSGSPSTSRPLSSAMHLPDAQDFDTVNNDDVLGGTLAVRHLHDVGYRNIAYLSLDFPLHNAGRETFALREKGYRAAMKELGLSQANPRGARAEQTPATSRWRRATCCNRGSGPEAIFCWTDFVALEVLSVARELGLSVPGDLAIVGYDNTSHCDLAQNSLTSIDQSGQVLGLQAARLLIERIKGRTAAEHFVITPRLVARASSKARKLVSGER